MKVKSYTIDLSEQMAVCDANYIRLLKLLGTTRSLSRRVITLPHLGKAGRREQISVHLEVLEDFKYTSTLCIRQQLGAMTPVRNGAATYHAPEMILRVYHDAKTAEVISYQNHKYFKAVYPVPNEYMYHSDEKEQLNLFLAEWLNLCLSEGLGDPGEMQLDRLSCL